jgi:asparaginyl-tRNA synthetase
LAHSNPQSSPPEETIFDWPSYTITPAMAEAAVATPTSPHVVVSPLSDLHIDRIGQTVILYGWVYSTRTQGAGDLVFCDINDGSTVTPVRTLAERTHELYSYGTTTTMNLLGQDLTALSFDELTQTSKLSLGCSVAIIGTIVTPPAGTTQAFEIKILHLFVIGGVVDPILYPIQKSILKKPTSLRTVPHARFRAPLIQQFMKIRSEALFAIHEFFHNENVPLLDPNIMTSSDCEGAGEVFKVTPQFFHKETTTTAPAVAEGGEVAALEQLSLSPPQYAVGLTVSSQLPLEAMAMGTGKVYTCQKSFRAEKSETNKHLAEFLHVEYEQYFITLPQLVDQAERYVKHVITTVLQRCKEQYSFLDGKNTAPVEFHGHYEYLSKLMEKPFVRITHREAIDTMLQDVRDKVQYINDSGKSVRLKFKELPQHGNDLASEHEKYLVQKYGTFVFVTHWPAAIKSFYMKQCDDADADGKGGTCEAFDLLAPIVGELFGGSMREWRYDVLMNVMAKRNMDVGPLQWFVDLRKDGTAPHGGWGMGFDRLVMFLCNAQSVRDVVPYPVYYGHCPY